MQCILFSLFFSLNTSSFRFVPRHLAAILCQFPVHCVWVSLAAAAAADPQAEPEQVSSSSSWMKFPPPPRSLSPSHSLCLLPVWLSAKCSAINSLFFWIAGNQRFECKIRWHLLAHSIALLIWIFTCLPEPELPFEAFVHVSFTALCAKQQTGDRRPETWRSLARRYIDTVKLAYPTACVPYYVRCHWVFGPTNWYPNVAQKAQLKVELFISCLLSAGKVS